MNAWLQKWKHEYIKKHKYNEENKTNKSCIGILIIRNTIEEMKRDTEGTIQDARKRQNVLLNTLNDF